jgi:phosphoribosyl 1,2-cyclic phosphodiesterase
MKLTFLGTAASEGYPNAFCLCQNCERARQLGGPSLRKRSAAVIDGVLLIDFGPDLMAASLMHGIPLAGVRACLQTHEHEDHLEPSNFLSRSREQSEVVGGGLLDYYATRGAIAHTARVMKVDLDLDVLIRPEFTQSFDLRVHPIAAGESFAVGRYRVTAIPATHGEGIDPLLYAIEDDGRTCFYATDTGPLGDDAWDTLRVLRDDGVRFNAVALDHTFGLRGRDTGHLNAEQFREEFARLRDEGLLAGGCRVFAHHLGHHSNPPHPALVEIGRAGGYEIAYDGLVVDV